MNVLFCVILISLVTGCSAKDMQVKETLDLIEQTENKFVEVGTVADNYKEYVYEYLKTGDMTKIKEFATETALNVLKEWKCTDFVVVKQDYMTAINHANITQYMLVRTKEGLNAIYLYWNENGLYGVELGEVL